MPCLFFVGGEGKIPFLCKQGRRRPFLAQLKLSASHFCATGADFLEFACYLGAKRGFFRKKFSEIGEFSELLDPKRRFLVSVAPKWDLFSDGCAKMGSFLGWLRQNGINRPG